MKVSAIAIYTDWCRIKNKTPSYRLGQHYCNVLGLNNTVLNNLDLFLLNNTAIADRVFYDMCETYQWDVYDLPIFGDYDLTTIRVV